MRSAKDYGFNDGYLLDSGAEAPGNFTTIGNVGDTQLVVPNEILDDEYNSYSQAVGSPSISKETFGQSFGAARAILKSVGLTKIPEANTIQVGSNFRGEPVYSSTKLANSRNITVGRKLAETSGIALGAMNAFKDFDEAGKFLEISQRAESPDLHVALDKFKTNKDVKGFVSALGGDKSLIDYTGYKLYENWNNLGPAQKSLGIAGAGIQGFRFSDGQTFREKKITPEIPGVPSMNAAEGLSLAGQGLNVASATRKWNQYSTIQETFYNPRKSNEIVNTANSLDLLGQGTDGRAVPIDESIMSSQSMQPEPHYGVGAATIPAGQGAPNGYSVVGKINGRSIVVPTSNRGSVVINAPDIASESATSIYNSWKKSADTRQDKGVVGGSALAGGLDRMTSANPYSLGAVVTAASLYNTPPPKEYGDMEHMSYIAGVSLQRLVTGGMDQDEKGKKLVSGGAFEQKNFDSNMKSLRAEYARNGVSSREIGYQLANQGYSEGRFDESQLVSLHRSLDMVFNANGFTLAQKLSTGKNKGLEILERRRG